LPLRTIVTMMKITTAAMMIISVVDPITPLLACRALIPW
jgi:hypothetical protein